MEIETMLRPDQPPLLADISWQILTKPEYTDEMVCFSGFVVSPKRGFVDYAIWGIKSRPVRSSANPKHLPKNWPEALCKRGTSKQRAYFSNSASSLQNTNKKKQTQVCREKGMERIFRLLLPPSGIKGPRRTVTSGRKEDKGKICSCKRNNHTGGGSEA